VVADVERTALTAHDVQRVDLEAGVVQLRGGPLLEDRPSRPDRRRVGGGEVDGLVRVLGDIEEHLVRPGPVVAVVPRPEVEVVTPADPTLAGPGTLRENEVVATGTADRDRLAVPPLRHAQSGELQDGGDDVVLRARRRASWAPELDGL
jgi:hypothetical protein